MADETKKALKISSPFSVWEQYAYGEIDPTGQPIIADYDDSSDGLLSAARATRRRAATPDIFKDVQFTRGVVLAVLSGPSADNDATTGGRLTKLLSTSGTRPWWEELSIMQGKKPPLRAIVKVFGLTPDLPMPKQWPPTPRDEQIISLYPEYIAIDPNMPGISEIRPGTMVRLQHNRQYQNNGGPLPVGTIVGVLGNRPADIQELKPSAKDGFNPKCASPLRIAGAAGGKYTTHTVALIDSGRLVKKVKNKIPLGVFGDGSIQTKSHFAASLQQGTTSLVSRISGETPGFRNAFIWVGHMKNNGYLDFVDRPHDLGRETIIYAPKYLDTGSPIELKYYFHDRTGFGYPWVEGPGTTTAQSIQNAALEGNDFAEKVGPAIKDLMRAGRNFILVIPEMMHSRGYGTNVGDVARIKAIKTGKNIGQGNRKPHGDVQRVLVESLGNSEAKKAMIELIDGYKRPSSQTSSSTLSSVNRWMEREFSTFDNSFTGGKFPLFHSEVIATIEAHLGTAAAENITGQGGYVSIVAEGASIVTLASMSTYMGADEALNITNLKRVDLVDNVQYDAFQGSPQLGARPSVVFFHKFVNAQALKGQPLEFNYHTSFNAAKQNGNNFFTDPTIGQSKLFNSNYNSGNSNAGRVFSFFNPLPVPNTQARNYTSLFLTDSPTIAALVSTNDFINPGTGFKPGSSSPPGAGAFQVNSPPLARNSLPRILNGEVPDHAAVLSSKPTNSKFLDVMAKKNKLVGEGGSANNPAPGSKMYFFRQFLEAFGQKGQNQICLISAWPQPSGPLNFQGFCTKSNSSDLLTVDASNGSLLQTAFKDWYNDMKELAKYTAEYEDQRWLNWVENLPKKLALDEVTKALADVNPALSDTKKPEKYEQQVELDQKYSKFNMADWDNASQEIETIFSALITLTPNQNHRQMPLFSGYVEEYVLTQRKKALEDLNKKLLGSKDDANSAASPADCPSPPRPLGIFGGGVSVNGAFSSGVVQCGSLSIPASAPTDFIQISSLIPYFPTRSDVNGNQKDTKLKQTPGFQLAGINHMTRRSGNNIGYMNSADYGTKVWECLAQKIQTSWEIACASSGYIPFRIIGGYRKNKTPNVDGGISLHDMGLAIDIDPSLSGDGDNWTRGVFTNAWLQSTVENEEINALGVYSEDAEDLIDNVYEDVSRLVPIIGAMPWIFRGDKYRRTHQYDDAYGVYKEELGTYLTSLHKGNIICPINSNPLLWVLVFCESSGMKWGNGTFMKKRYRGGNDWNDGEKNKLDRIFNINNVVERVRAISWKQDARNDHMHFQFWDGIGKITYEEIAEAARLSGVDYKL